MLHRVAFVFTVILGLLIANVPQVSADVTDEDIERAIRKAKNYFYNNQKDGNWEHLYKNPHAGQSGVTAMITYALLSSGESMQRKEIQAAIKFLREIDRDSADEPLGTYEVGLRAHAWGQLPDSFSQYMKEEKAWLADACAGTATFTYHAKKSAGSTAHDHSNTQYGVLGLWEAAKRGVPIEKALWEACVTHFVGAQGADGGWNYRAGDARPSYSRMTAAGLAALLVAQQELYRNDPKPNPKVYKSIEKGLKWVDNNFSPNETMYGIYGYERVGLATGRKYFNGKDWFNIFASAIVKRQAGDGKVGNAPDTAFALLFLSRGRVPIWCTKLMLKDFNWDNRPNDIYFLTSKLSEFREGELNFQTVALDAPDSHWFNAPIAWISGDDQLELNEEQKAKLKRFIDEGGMLIFNPESGSAGGSMFKNSVRKLAGELYPTLKMKPLTNDHFLFNVHHKIDNGAGMRINALDNGARLLMVMPEKDWGMLFQGGKTSDSQYKAATNLFVLATERAQLDNRLAVSHMARKNGTSKGDLLVARAKYDGNWLPEPGVWDVMSTHVFNKADYNVKTVDVDLDKLGESNAPIVHLTGTDPIKLSDAQKASIKQYVEGGGLIVVETVGGRRLFAGQMEEQIGKIFGTAATRLGRGSPILSGEGLAGGYNNKYVTYRHYSIVRLGARNEPRLATIVVNGRPAVIISHEDLSLGALGVRREGVLGYSRKSSVRLLTNMVLAAHQKPGEANDGDKNVTQSSKGTIAASE